MPKFQKPMWNVISHSVKDPESDALFGSWVDARLRASNAESALRRVKRERPFEPGTVDWEVVPVYGPEMTTDMASKRARREARRRRDSQLYALYRELGPGGGDHVVPLTGTNYWEAAEHFFWPEDVKDRYRQDLDFDALRSASDAALPFRNIREGNDMQFGIRLNERLEPRGGYLFGLRRGGRNRPPVYLNHENRYELQREKWSGEDPREEEWLRKYMDWRY